MSDARRGNWLECQPDKSKDFFFSLCATLHVFVCDAQKLLTDYCTYWTHDTSSRQNSGPSGLGSLLGADLEHVTWHVPSVYNIQHVLCFISDDHSKLPIPYVAFQSWETTFSFSILILSQNCTQKAPRFSSLGSWGPSSAFHCSDINIVAAIVAGSFCIAFKIMRPILTSVHSELHPALLILTLSTSDMPTAY